MHENFNWIGEACEGKSMCEIGTIGRIIMIGRTWGVTMSIIRSEQRMCDTHVNDEGEVLGSLKKLNSNKVCFC